MRRLSFCVLALLVLGCGQEHPAGPVAPPARLEPAAPSAPKETRRIPVRSSFIDLIGYDAGNQILEIEMNRGKHLYRYLGVPSHVFEGIMAAFSKGRFLNANIKGVYRYQRIRPGLREMAYRHPGFVGFKPMEFERSI